ncbi:MAG: sigma-70 family RNA polymerase sigma factor [Ignavibacteriales bacterium]|jgi:RNA polymerase sigma-70 factor (ECF subfamily)|nr:MAG: sigma-70 family RNA polymerase sigma factor [Ignavibacteriaceae bacterium]MBW7872133.1 sigma-70 family RNA polymerase sigma factor [Ignavibacteria bacterium]MCZ2143767.1 sigma-70 family RNA polymerase sigma factor [Ignavibacteriales bacterium]OQY76963.1 MAG: hypothetical protein B6D45_03250 [Ignavibacteriales bacterium UTCHB3]MBV6445973.1 ECF RNA polymerase sigma factor SigK [Ignavibacteriaceae bacterium]
MSDHELLIKIAKRDTDAFRDLYRRYSKIVYALVSKIIEDEVLADTIFEEIFVIIWNKANRYDINSQNAYCWIITLARNKAVDAKRRKWNPALLEEYSDDYENYIIIPHLSKQIDPLDLETALNISKNIENAVMRLTEAQQHVIYLGLYFGFTQSEISKNLNIPVQTVNSKIRLALGSLRDNLLHGEA